MPHNGRWRLLLASCCLLVALFTLFTLSRSVQTLLRHDSMKADASGPLKGLYVFGASGSSDDLTFSNALAAGGNILIPWAQLEPHQGVYDWAVLDNAIANSTASGKKLIVRIYTNTDATSAATPDWFFALSGALSYYPSGAAQSKDIKAPVPWDPVYVESFGDFIRALGARYDGNDMIDFFQTNAGGGVYGEMYLGDQTPPGWDSDVQRNASINWLNTWLSAFPTTHLSVMVNELNGGLGEDVASYAASYGVYLQQNTPWLSKPAVALFKNHQSQTRIVVEAEDAGCRSATGAKFNSMAATLFSYGFRIDYLTLCLVSFRDPGTAAQLPALSAKLAR